MPVTKATGSYIRALTGWECVSLAGWSDDFWSYAQLPARDTMVSMARNAFSSLAIGPVLVGMVQLLGSRSSEPRLKSTVGEASDSDSNQS